MRVLENRTDTSSSSEDELQGKSFKTYCFICQCTIHSLLQKLEDTTFLLFLVVLTLLVYFGLDLIFSWIVGPILCLFKHSILIPAAAVSGNKKFPVFVWTL